MTDKDKPKVLGSIAAIKKEAGSFDRDPARFALPDGGFITFPDPMEMEAFESDELLHTLLNEDNQAGMRKWLSTEDFDKVAALRLTRREMRTLVQDAVEYYDDVFGAQGESPASDS